MSRRGLTLERFEERCLLTSGPILLSITANDGSMILPNTPPPTFHTDPSQLTFLFNEGEAINPSSLGGIELVRAGTDHQLGTADDVTITPGFVGLGATANQVVMRFSSPLPDDLYQLTILGTGPNELTDSSSPPNPFNSKLAGEPNLELPFTIDVGPKVLSVVPQPISRNAAGTLSQATNEVDVYFSKAISPLPLTVNQLDPNLFQLYYTADQANPTGDNPAQGGAPIHPVSVSFDGSTNMARLLFQQPLSQYAVDPNNPGVVAGGGAFRLRIGNSQLPAIVAPGVVNFNDPSYTGPTPGSSFNDVTSPAFYAGVLDGQPHQVFEGTIGPVSIDPGLARPGGNFGQGQRTIPDPGVESNIAAVPQLTLLGDAATLSGAEFSVGAFKYLLQQGNLPPAPVGFTLIVYNPGDTADTIAQDIANQIDRDLGLSIATVLGTTVSLDGTAAISFTPLNATALAQMSVPLGPEPAGTIKTITYNFPTIYGNTPGNTGLPNLITPEQAQLAREIFSLYSRYLGVQFQEVADETTGAAEIGVVTGVVQAIQQSLAPNLPGISGDGLAVMNHGVFFSESQYGGPWFTTAMHEIGTLLGLGMNYEGPPGTVMGSGAVDPVSASQSGANGVFPGNADILHGRYLFPTDSNQIDLYKFTVDTPGTLTAETVAQRLATSSLLNTALTLYQETNLIQLPGSGPTPVGNAVVPGSTFTVNDNVNPVVTFEFSAVPAGSTLAPGTLLPDGHYAIPFTPTTSAAHDVAVSLAAAVNNLVASHTVALDVSASVQFNRVQLIGPVTVLSLGNQGGVTYTVSRSVVARNDDYFGNDSFIDLKLAPGNYYLAVTSTGNTNFDPTIPNSGSGGTTQGAYDLKLDFTPTAVTNLTDLDGNVLLGNSNGVTGGAYNSFFNVGNTIFVDKTAPSGGDGSLAAPFNNIADAMSLAGNRIIAPIEGGRAVNLQGQTFVVNDGSNPPVTFEFDSIGNVAAGNQAVHFNVTDSQGQIANDIASAIQNAVAQGLLASGFDVQEPDGDETPPGTPGDIDAIVNGGVVDVLGAQSLDLRGAPSLTPASSPGATKIVRIVGNSGPDNAIGVPIATASQITAGETFSVTGGTLSPVVFEFTTAGRAVAAGHLAVVLPPGNSPTLIASAIAAAIDASPLAQASGGAIVASVPAEQPADATAVWVTMTGVGQITINAQATPVLKAASNAQAYLLGFSQFNNSAPLADGTDLIVPQDVTLMIDAGAMFKLAGANIDDGQTTPNVDRSGAALQVLGTPTSSVYFTSFHDNTLGQALDNVTKPQPGDWGGLVFRPQSDLAAQAIFLNNVDYANIRYAGGSVGLSPNNQLYSPIYISGSQPTVTNNTITLSNDAAISADPDSFKETEFGSPAFGGTLFSIDYNRVGPDIQGNVLSVNVPGGLIITAPAGNALVSGETFTITNPNLPPTAVVAGGVFTFEFVSGTSQAAGAVLPDGNFAVPFNPPSINPITNQPNTGDTPAQVAASIVSAIQAANIGIGASVVLVNNQPTGQVSVTGASSIILTAPQFITAQPGSNLAAGQTFQVFNPTSGTTFVFEYTTGGPVATGHFAVNFNSGDADTQVAIEIATAINSANVGADALAVGSQVFLTGGSSFALSSSGANGLPITSPSNTVMPPGASLTDGTTFQITNTINKISVTFEFDSDPTPNTSGGSTPTVTPGNIPIEFQLSDSDAQVAAETAAAINGASFGVTALAIGNEIVLVGPTGVRFSSALSESATIAANAINGLQIRTTDVVGQLPAPLTVSARWDATDITYFMADNLIIQGQPGGNLQAGEAGAFSSSGANALPITAPTATVMPSGANLADGTTFQVTNTVTGQTSTFEFDSNNQVITGDIAVKFLSTDSAATVAAEAMAAINAANLGVVAAVSGDEVILGPTVGRPSARLAVDPDVIVKVTGSRIEVQTGGQLIAEAQAGHQAVFTSAHDETYGGGGTFDTDGDKQTVNPQHAGPGDWGGIYFGPASEGSFDHAQITFAGGFANIEGGADNFNAIEIRQADVRIANSTLADNAGGTATTNRNGRGTNTAATIYVLGAQPVLINNVIENNKGDAINIDANSFTSDITPDPGRSTGAVDAYTQYAANQGPLVALNRLGNNDINGMVVRGGTLDTSSVWDDTDIVYVLFDQINVLNYYQQGGLRLESNPNESLVVKLQGPNAGFTANGTALDVNGRLGGAVQIIGTPQHNVILTALSDSSVGAGLTPDGRPQNNTTNSSGGVSLFVGPNVNITQSMGNKSETTISVNPTNTQNIFEANTSAFVDGIAGAARVSFDGGKTWTTSDMGKVDVGGGDVQTAWDQFGNLFIVGFSSGQAAAAVDVGRSSDGGRTFKDQRVIATGNLDQPSIAVGSGGSTAPGSVWVSYSNAKGVIDAAGAPVNGFDSVGTFGTPESAPGPGGNFGSIAIGPNGQVMVNYQQEQTDPGPDTIDVNLDPDGLGGQGFGPAIAPPPAPNTNVGAELSVPPQPGTALPARGIDAESNLAWDTSGGAHNGRVYLVYVDRANLNTVETRIFIRFSDDNGQTWSKPTQVSDLPTGNGKTELQPAISVDETTGNVAVTWYDTRNSDASDQQVEIFGTVSSDGGVTWAPNVQIAAGLSNATVPAVGNFYLGDYDLMSFTHGVFYRSWADNSNSTGDNPGGTLQTQDVYTARVTVTQGGGVALSSPGSWLGVQLNTWSNDTNVATVMESEPALTGGLDQNNTITSSQPLGLLAPDVKSGDDTQRLGFDIHGAISPDAPGDTDIYNFQAQAGTQVWIAASNTAPTLDTVIELLNANGTVVARSDNANAEAKDSVSAGNPLAAGPLLKSELPSNAALPLTSDTLLDNTYDPLSQVYPGLRNFGSTNPLDAGFRVVLPGQVGTAQNYYVRIYSKGPTKSPTGQQLNPYIPGIGLTSGIYDLQIRLQELNQVPGSQVQYADIRFATNGIAVNGLPAHSPLLAEAGQGAGHTTDALTNANPSNITTTTIPQPLGNLLNSDQTAIGVAGSLTSPTEVDWYSFTVDYDLVQSLQGVNAGDKTFPAIFDIGYADGLARPNSTISIFNSTGQLIFTGRDSNIADQQPRPNQGADLANLSHGSVGKLDPYIGTVQLPAGEVPSGNSHTYYIAISSDATLPAVLDATFDTSATQPLARLEPIDSINRVAEDHIGSEGGQTAQNPDSLTPLFPGTTPVELNTAAASFNLGNVVLYVDQGGPNGHLQIVNPFTGAVETNVGQTAGSTGFGLGGFAMRNDGEIYAFSQIQEAVGEGNNQNNIDRIDPGTGLTMSAIGDNIPPFEFKPGGNGGQPTVVSNTLGMQVNAATFKESGPSGRTLFAVASYPGGDGIGGGFDSPFTNGLYVWNGDTLQILGKYAPPNFPHSNPEPEILSANGKITGLAEVNDILYGVTDAGGLYEITNPFGAASAQFIASPFGSAHFSGLSAGPPDIIDPTTGNPAFANVMFATDSNGRLYAFDTTGKAVAAFAGGATSISTGLTGLTGMAFSTLDYNLWHVTNQRGTDLGHGINLAPDNSRNPFSANQPTQGVTGNTSFYFGLEDPRSKNTISTQPGAANYEDPGPVVNPNSAVYNTYDLPGGAMGSLVTNAFSLANYTATDKPTVYFDYYLNSRPASSSTQNPGTMVDSARVFASTDGGQTWQMLATNNSHLATSNTDPNAELPSFLSTSSSNGSNDIANRQRVQQLFDTAAPGAPNDWRQARIDLADFAGASNVELRFDFSTAGTMAQGIRGDSFGNLASAARAQDGDPLLGNASHEGFYVDDVIVGFAERGEMVTNVTANTSFFEVPQNRNVGAPTQILTGPYQLEMRQGTEYGQTVIPTLPDIALTKTFDTNDRLTAGFTIQAPPGTAIVAGETFTISDGLVSHTFEFVTNPATVLPGDVAVTFSPTDDGAAVAHEIAQAINSVSGWQVSAGTVDNFINGPFAPAVTTGTRVDIFGAVSVIQPNVAANRITVAVNPANQTIAENGGHTTATVTRQGSTATALSVQLNAIDVSTGAASLNAGLGPARFTSLSVLIPAGQASTTVDIFGTEILLPNGTQELADGTQTVEVVPSAPGFTGVADIVNVTDAPGVLPALTLAITPVGGKKEIIENSVVPMQATLTRNSPTNVPLTVNLQSLNPAAASVPVTVTIPANQASVSFAITPVDNGIINPGGQQTATILATDPYFTSGRDTLTVDDDGDGTIPFGTLSWSAQGPNIIVSGAGQQTLSKNITPGNPGIGAVQTIIADPTNANVVYLGSVNGGIWKTTNAQSPSGPTWVNTTPNLPSLKIGRLAFDLADAKHQTIVAGIGETSSFSVFVAPPENLTGILRSTDGGTTWAQLGTKDLAGQNIMAVAETGNTILTASRFFPGGTTTAVQGIWRSTDTGKTFTIVSGANGTGLPAGGVSDVVADPFNTGTYYAWVLTQGIYKSTDSGATWTKVLPKAATVDANNDNGRIAVSNGAVFFGIVESGTASNVFRSADGGTTWTSLGVPATAINSVGSGSFQFALAADPSNNNLVYISGDANGDTSYASVFRGDASATTIWTSTTDLGSANDSSPHVDSRAMTFDAAGDLLFGSDGGIYARTSPQNATGTWLSYIGSGLQITEFHSVAYDTLSNTIVGGSQDNSTELQNVTGGKVWTTLNGGDGGDVAVDNSDPAQAVVYSAAEFLGNFTRTTYDANNNVISTTSVALNGLASATPFYTPVVLNAVDPKRLVIGATDTVYESFDQGDNITSLNSGADSSLLGQQMAYGGILNGKPNPDVLWVGASNGASFQVLLRTTAGGPLAPTNYPGNAVTALAIDPTNWQNAVVADAKGHVWLTTDAGASYTDVTGLAASSTALTSLTQDLTAIAIVPTPGGGGTVYVGGMNGVFSMQTGVPGVWSTYGTGMPHVPVYTIEYVPSQQLLVVGTLGRGAFTIPSSGGSGNIIVTVNGSNAVTDDAGTLTNKVTITRVGSTTAQTVSLVSSDPNLATVPATISFASGQTVASVNVTIVDDAAVARYPGTVVFTAVGGANSISDALDVTPDAPPDDAPASPGPADADTPALSVSVPSGTVIQASGGIASVLATVTRNTRTDQPLTVYLASSDPTVASVDQGGGVTTVVIPAGQTSATFLVSAVDQFVTDTPRQIAVFAAASGLLAATGEVEVNPTNHILSYDLRGDKNINRPQGQVLVQDNKISGSSGYDVIVDSAPRDASGSIPHLGVVRNLSTINGPPQAPPGGLVPGPVIENNVLISGGSGAILFSGDPDPAGQPLSADAFGRIVNNTIYGGATRSGTGVQVQQNAGPTIINNIFANLSTAINVDGSSSASAFHPTVVTANAYQNNASNLVSVNGIVETDARYLATTDALFSNPAVGDFYLVHGSPAVDSATDELADRAAMTAAKNLTGIPASPIFAPSRDIFGQLRGTDPTGGSSGGGLGSNNTKDRGAIERVDITGPLSTLVNPIDNGAEDQDPAFNVVHVVGQSFTDFAIQFTDPDGTGVDNNTVKQSEFALYRNGTALIEGIDYFFSYDTNTKTVHFTPAPGVWLTGSQYTIFVDNGINFDAFNALRTPVGIRDIAGNLLQPNSASGFTRYDILLQSINGDAPVVSVPPTQNVDEGTPLVFSNATGNSISIFDIEGGANPIQVTLTAANGTLTIPASALSGVTFINGTANGQATISFSGQLANVNAALQGLTYLNVANFAGIDKLSIAATDTGTGRTGLGNVQISVIRVDQAPVNTVPGPQATPENAPLVFSSATGNAISISDMDAAIPPGTGIEQVTLTAVNGAVTLSGTSNVTIIAGTGTGDVSVTFQGTIPNINAALNGLIFQPALNFVGNASLTIATDDLGNTGLGGPLTTTSHIAISVFHVDQPPTVVQANTVVTVNENAPPTTIDLRTIFTDADYPLLEGYPIVTLSSSTNPTLVAVGVNGTTLTLSYGANQFGKAILTLTATDQGPSHAQTSATITVNVIKVEQRPQPHDDFYLYNVNTPLSVTAPGVLANDVEVNGEQLHAVLFQVPANGKLVLNPDGSFSYLPNAGFNGEDAFIYMADNGTFRTPATVYLDSVPSRWVARMYTEVLGRASHPSPAEVNYWVGQLNAGVSHQQISSFFVTSPERRSHVIGDLYETYLGRAVDVLGLNYWLNVWSANSGPEQVQAGIIGSQEFYDTAGGTDATWVTALYQNLFERNPAPNEVAFWTGYLAANGSTNATRTIVVLGFVTSNEYRLNLLRGIPGDPDDPDGPSDPNEPNDSGWYEQYLHRPIDIAGANFWLAQMQAGLPQETILIGILSSDEYVNRV
jgi:hypothetical protein